MINNFFLSLENSTVEEGAVTTNFGDAFQQQRFGPRDLTALLKSLEKEIESYEVLLAEEMEKRKNYRVIPYSKFILFEKNL